MSNNEVTPSEKENKSQGNWWLVLSVVALIVSPLVLVKGEYTGADGQAHEAIAQIQPNYEPWLETIVEPASAEVESFLFATQAALGAGAIGYIIGIYQGRKHSSRQEEE